MGYFLVECCRQWYRFSILKKWDMVNKQSQRNVPHVTSTSTSFYGTAIQIRLVPSSFRCPYTNLLFLALEHGNMLWAWFVSVVSLSWSWAWSLGRAGVVGEVDIFPRKDFCLAYIIKQEGGTMDKIVYLPATFIAWRYRQIGWLRCSPVTLGGYHVHSSSMWECFSESTRIAWAALADDVDSKFLRRLAVSDRDSNLGAAYFGFRSLALIPSNHSTWIVGSFLRFIFLSKRV